MRQPITVPAALAGLRSWLVWRYESEPGVAKPRKVPYYISGARRHGEQGSPDDLAALATLERAQRAARIGKYDGIGLAMLASNGIVALDFDNCFTGGQLDPTVAELVASTYAETSPSGKGVRAFFTGTLEELADKKSRKGPFGFETFERKGFVTVTGQILPECEFTGATDAAPLARTVRWYAAERFASAGQVVSLEPQDPVGLSEDEASAMLATLDPSMGHDEWLAVGMALHHESGGAWFEHWNDWSAASEKYPGRDVLLHRWNSFGRSPKPITAKTLIHMAGRPAASLDEFEPVEATSAQSAPGEPSADQAHPAQEDPLDEFPDETAHSAHGAPGQPSADQVQPRKRGRFTPMTVDEFLARPKAGYIVQGLVPKADLVVIYGDSGSGKTFVALDIVASIARGVPWRGRKTRQGRVVYLCAEGNEGFQNRVDAYRREHQCDLRGMEIIAAQPNLMEKPEALEVGREIGRCDVLVIDTFAQVMPMGNENSGEDMGKVLMHCRGLRRMTGAVIILIHHSGKDASRGARGWSGLRAAADAELEVVRANGARLVRVSKQKDGQDGLLFGFQLDIVNLGLDESGELLTSCVVREVEVAQTERTSTLPDLVRAKVESYLELDDSGVDEEQVIAEVMATVPKATPKPDGTVPRDTRRQSIQRAIRGLCEGARPVFRKEGNLLCAA